MIEISANSVEVFDDRAAVEPLIGRTDFDAWADQFLVIRWNLSGDLPISDWHVYVKKGDGGYFFVGRKGDGDLRIWVWKDPDVNAQYQFCVWGLYVDESGMSPPPGVE